MALTKTERVFLVGIGGIGMSGLAQLLRHQGYEVAGSDRGLQEAGKALLYDDLRACGLLLYPQDGSGVREFVPDILVKSTAVEADNADLCVAEENGIPIVHRAYALAEALRREKGKLIAVAGSCGKTSVTGWIAEALRALGEKVLFVNGGYCTGCRKAPGNFDADEAPDWLVVEVDESDKSIAEFSPDYGVLLNVGDDHYERAELQRVFGEFLGRCREGAAVLSELRGLAPFGMHLACFSPVPSREGDFWPEEYKVLPSGMRFRLPDGTWVESTQSGQHSAWNACAVMALLSLLPLGRTAQELARSLAAFQGVQQRFEYLGNRADGVPFVNDYAHNPEKITAAITAARERFGAPLYLVFQPHGFAPLGFMREALLSHLAEALQKGDRLVFLPVFYAGGTAAFHPTSEDVVAEAVRQGLPVVALERKEVERELSECHPAAVVVMGARDSSLRPWTLKLVH